MRVRLFYHSLISDWNHGNAHFLRGIAAELGARGHDVVTFEPADAWSAESLVSEHGEEPLRAFERRFPNLRSVRYGADFNVESVLDDADLVIVHEWNSHELVRRAGAHHARKGGYLLFFHDTHHRSVTDPDSMAAYDLSGYDGVLAYGKTLRRIYLDRRWARRVWTWHEAADVRVFHPPAEPVEKEGDVVWIGNWGDEERTAELYEYFIDPVRELKLRARAYGVRYPKAALRALEGAGIEYGGWLANYEVPAAFARFRVTLHIPRRPYATTLPGIPTIRPFEAMACGIVLISSPWNDSERLFTPGEDFLTARNGAEMRTQMRAALDNPELAGRLSAHGRETILARHTCAHRVDQLLEICEEVRSAAVVEEPVGMSRVIN